MIHYWLFIFIAYVVPFILIGVIIFVFFASDPSAPRHASHREHDAAEDPRSSEMAAKRCSINRGQPRRSNLVVFPERVFLIGWFAAGVAMLLFFATGFIGENRVVTRVACALMFGGIAMMPLSLILMFVFSRSADARPASIRSTIHKRQQRWSSEMSRPSSTADFLLAFFIIGTLDLLICYACRLMNVDSAGVHFCIFMLGILLRVGFEPVSSRLAVGSLALAGGLFAGFAFTGALFGFHPPPDDPKLLQMAKHAFVITVLGIGWYISSDWLARAIRGDMIQFRNRH